MKYSTYIVLFSLSSKDVNAANLKMIPAAGNDALPPQSTTTHSATDIPLHVQFATASKDGYPVRGEKNW